ncbi:MAG TPA: hypothetical protein DDW27_02385 [Bacteroidales bacterium]|nr:hypothetical protein [Bacteroidales bacterium]
MRRSIYTKGLILGFLMTGLLMSNIQAQNLSSALLLTKSEQYDKAEEMLNQLIQKEPSNAKNYFHLGENYLLEYFADTISISFQIATDKAKETYQKGVNANPNDPLNYVGLAKIALYQGDDKTAGEIRTKAKSFLLPYKNIKKIQPPAPEYAYALAKIAESFVREKSADTASALPLIRQAIKIDPKNPEIYLIAGDIYIAVNDGSNAIKNYNLAQYYNPKSPTANMKIGNIYVRGKNLNVAIPYFEEAIALDPNYAPAYRELAQLFALAGRHAQSKENYQKYLDLNKGNIPAMTRYVTSLFYAGDYEEVIKNIEEIFAVDKSRSYMNRLAGYSSFELASKSKNGSYDQAFKYMDQLFKTLPEERILWKDHHYMARIIVRKNQNYPALLDELSSLENQLENQKRSLTGAGTAAAKAKIQPAINELTAKIETLKADIEKADKELDRAFIEFDKVSEIRPQDKTVLSEMAANYYNFRRYDKAARTWARLIDPNEENLESFMQVGRAFYNGRNYKSADSLFNVIIKKSPDYLPAHLWLARTSTRIDPDNKTELAKNRFISLTRIAQPDSLKNRSEMAEAFNFLGYYYMNNNELNKARDLYNRWLNFDPNDSDYRIRAYQGIGAIELIAASSQPTIEGRLGYLTRSKEAYERILAIDPRNTSAVNQLNYVRDYEAQVKKGINPNEIKGIIRDAGTGQPIAFASVRVKDTAAEILTNTKGEFKFEIPKSSEALIISAPGYQSQEIPVTKSRIYNVSLAK